MSDPTPTPELSPASGPPFTIQHLPLVQSHLRQRIHPLPKIGAGPPSGGGPITEDILRANRALQFDLEQLPYCLAGGFDALERLRILLSSVADTAAPEVRAQANVVHMLPLDMTQPMAFAVDAYLDAARRAQNALTLYIGRAFRMSLPTSINDLVKDIETGRRSVDPAIDELMTKYWKDHGERLKDYRDLAQHFALVSSDVRVFFVDSTPHVFLALPNNPESKSASALRYRDPVVPAYRYCKDSFLALFRFVYEVTYVIARRLGPLDQFTISFMPKDPIVGGAQPGEIAPNATDLADALIAERRGLKDACLRAHGSLDAPPSARG